MAIIRKVAGLRRTLLLALVTATLLCSAMANEDFYQILGLARNADKAEIKKGYRKKSLEHHPDKNPGDEDAANNFARVARAYEVLSDDVKRQIYDTQGEEEVNRMERGGDTRRKGPNSNVNVQVSLENLYVGHVHGFDLTRNVYCRECQGSGAEGGKFTTCSVCKGAGQTTQKVNMGFMTIDMQTPCTKCGGKGKQPTKKCPHCKGLKVVKEAKKIELEIEAGMKNGDTIVFERQGEQVPDMIQGDIVFTIKQNTHPTFKRVGDNLYYNLDISLQEALLGFSKNIPHLDGHYVQVSSEGGQVAQPFSWKIIPGEGMPIRGTDRFGELHVKLIVGFPAKLSPTQKGMVEKIFPE